MCALGSESASGRAAISGLLNAVRHEAGNLDVVDAYVDGQEPSIASVVEETSGPRSIVPLMLAYDSPVSVDVVQASHLDPLVKVTAPLGPDWVLAELGVKRLLEAGARADDSIVLAADATSSDRAAADIGKAAQLLSAVWGGRVHVGSLGGPDAPLADAVDVARAYGHRVVISTYVLTEGSACDQIATADADIVTEPLLNGGPPDPRLVRLILSRVRLKGPGSNDSPR